MKEIFDILPKIAVGIQKIIEEHAGKKGSGEVNESGDTQTKLDILTDFLVEEFFKEIPSIKEIVSEEKKEPQLLHEQGEYLVAYDSLDGSSVSDVDLTIGSIFAIFKNDYSGPNCVGAAYIMYGPRLEFVIAETKKVIHYKYINGKFVGDYLPNLESKGKLLAPGSLVRDQFQSHKDFIDELWNEGYKLRYSGSMVPDMHQIIYKGGGMFTYPNTTTHPEGRLRKIYEIIPFAFILEQLGGGGIDHHGNRILNLGYKNVHEGVSCYLGSQYEIEKAKEFLKK